MTTFLPPAARSPVRPDTRMREVIVAAGPPCQTQGTLPSPACGLVDTGTVDDLA